MYIYIYIYIYILVYIVALPQGESSARCRKLPSVGAQGRDQLPHFFQLFRAHLSAFRVTRHAEAAGWAIGQVRLVDDDLALFGRNCHPELQASLALNAR